MNRKIKTLFKLAAGGGFVGWVVSMLIGATAVGILGAGFGGPAGLVFAFCGAVIAFAGYGVYQLLRR